MVNAVKTWWNRLSSWALGRWFFSRVVGFLIPYTGSISPNIAKLAPGFAEVFIKDKRKNRNHLRCIHALALGNLGELTTGLALHYTLQGNKRAILTNLNVQFFKKSRGVITARAIIDRTDDVLGPIVVEANLFDRQGDVVAKVQATWLVGQS